MEQPTTNLTVETKGRFMRCACVLVHINDPTNYTNRCSGRTNVDQPFCDLCETLHRGRPQFGTMPMELLAEESRKKS